jgi:hypothetical protein
MDDPRPSAAPPATGKPPAPPRRQAAWPWVLCLIGLDYFSTLGYQPSIAYQAAGLLAPLATAVVVAVTLAFAFPVYAFVAGRSPHGQGSIGLLERLVPGWKGKVLVLVLLGFAATNFVFSRTFSVADAAVHLLHNPNPYWRRALDGLASAGEAARPLSAHPLWQCVWDYWDRQMVTTLALLVLVFVFWAVFWRVFARHVFRLAAAVVGLYLLLSALVVGSGLAYLAGHAEICRDWWANVLAGQWQVEVPPVRGAGAWAAAAASVILLPKLALGLSGFELSMVAMPLVAGDAPDEAGRARGSVRNTRRLLAAAALIMGAFLTGSALVTALLIPPDAFGPAGEAADRALAYLAHGGGRHRLSPLFGASFGTLYDASTVLILSLAGAAVTIGLRDLVPPYLQRLGMEPPWALAVGTILYAFSLVKLAVTVLFHASVSAQRGAYATSVLMLFASAAVAAAVAARRQKAKAVRTGAYAYFVAAAAVFLTTAGAVMAARPDGVLIALGLIVVTVLVSMASRVLRSTELRFHGFEFADDRSRFLWESLVYLEFPVLVPHRPGRRALPEKEAEIRARHRLGPDVPVVFVEASLGDPSEFYQLPRVEVRQEDGRFVVRVTRCTSVAHAIAAVALELSRGSKPPEVHFGWSDEHPFVANLHFVLFGLGNVPWMVRELIRKAEPRPERRPGVVIG